MRLCVSVYVSCMCLCASVCMHTCIQYIYTDRQTYCMHAYRQTEIWHRHACIHPSIRADRHAFIGIFWMGLIRWRRSAGRHCCTRRFPLSLTLHRVDLLSKKLSCGTTPTTHWIQRRPPTFSASTHLCWCRPSSRRMLLPPSDSRLICVLSLPHYLPRSVSLSHAPTYTHIQVEAYPIYAPGKTRPRMTQGPLRLLPALVRLRYHA